MQRFLTYSFTSLLFLSFSLGSQFTLAVPEVVPKEDLVPTKAQSVTTIDIIKKLGSRHYRDLTVDDDLSREFLDNYLESLDPSRLYFYEADVKGFEQNKNKFDDYLKKGQLNEGFKIYHVYRERVLSRLDYVLAKLGDKENKFEFISKELVEIDREKAPWPKNTKEADVLWNKRLKLSLLNLKLAGKTVEEARETLVRRYNNQKNRITQQNSRDIYEILINAFTVLYDPHTNYFSPRTSENFNINMSLQLEGIGAVLQTEDEHTKVVRLVPGGPAFKQGQLKPADKIISVGQGAKGELTDVVGWRLDEVVDMIRGKKGTQVRLEVLKGEAEPEIIVIQRGTVKLEDQAAQKAVIEINDGEQMRKIGVIDIPAFYHDFDAYRRGDMNFKSTTRDVARLLSELASEDVEGIILDLRNNGGGSLQEATNLTDLFIDQGPVVQIRESTGRVSQQNRSRSRAFYRGPLVVMINRLSASASEIFAGAIQDYDRGIIVGSQSFGKGTVQLLSELPEGQLKLTESKFYRVSGDSTQHRGVIPDINLPVLIDHDEVGESAYDTALPWDQIPQAKHGRYYNYAPLLPTLNKLSAQRASKDPDIVKMLDQMALALRNKDRKTVSLNEKERIQEKELLEVKAMEIENKHRQAKGEKPFKDLAAYKADKEKEDEEREAANAEPQKAIDLESDPLLNETGYILLDLLEMTDDASGKRVANIKTTTASTSAK